MSLLAVRRDHPRALVIAAGPTLWWRLFAALIFALGLAGLAGDHFGLPQPRIFNLHLLFGLALSWGIAARLLERRRALRLQGGVSFSEYTRGLTRWVYILLYALAGVRICLRLVDIIASTSAAHTGMAATGIPPMADFQVYVAYGVIPLWVIRSLIGHPRHTAD